MFYARVVFLGDSSCKYVYTLLRAGPQGGRRYSDEVKRRADGPEVMRSWLAGLS